jgi:hypothetical protein
MLAIDAMAAPFKEIDSLQQLVLKEQIPEHVRMV